MKQVNTIPIENFLDKARVAVKSKQKTLILTLDEVIDLQHSLALVMSKLYGEAEQAPTAQQEPIEIKMNGGKF